MYRGKSIRVAMLADGPAAIALLMRRLTGILA